MSGRKIIIPFFKYASSTSRVNYKLKIVFSVNIYLKCKILNFQSVDESCNSKLWKAEEIKKVKMLLNNFCSVWRIAYVEGEFLIFLTFWWNSSFWYFLMIVFVVSARLSFLSKVTVQQPKPQPVILELKLKQKKFLLRFR